jgi:predicted amidohydrolase
MADTVRIAGVQMDVAIGQREKNLGRMIEFLAQTSRHKALLTVFPECALSGYCFNSLEEARPHAEPVPGPSTLRLAEACREFQTYAVMGLLEVDGARLFNACVLSGPEGQIGTYRKVHLPYLGIDRFTTPGDRGFGVWSCGPLRIGMGICYDAAFPEATRVMALDGADLIVLPTNWPPGAECTCEFVINARALENHVYFLAVNRAGEERGFRFIGRSKACEPAGKTMFQARADGEEVFYVDIDPALARRKRVIRVPGLHEIDRFADRRPEWYGRIMEK